MPELWTVIQRKLVRGVNVFSWCTTRVFCILTHISWSSEETSENDIGSANLSANKWYGWNPINFLYRNYTILRITHRTVFPIILKRIQTNPMLLFSLFYCMVCNQTIVLFDLSVVETELKTEMVGLQSLKRR